jgi:predicted phosphodiesterase
LLYAIISDVHANLEATEACFREIDNIKPDKVICLGDMVDYCAQPNEVMDIISRRCDVIIMGNHDEAQVDYYISDGFSDSAKISSVHTRTVLKQENKQFISTLQYTHSEINLLFVHASPFNPREYDYVLDKFSAQMNFRSFDESVCFIGHSHQPIVFEEKRFSIKAVSPQDVKKGNRFIINVGSVGQPRDRDPRLAFGLFDTEKFKYQLVRLEYDIESASKKIIDEGLPLKLAERLFLGI